MYYSFKPLRDYLLLNALTATRLTQDLNLSSNVAAAINNDRPITIENIAKICRHLDVPIERVIEIKRNT